MYTTLALPFEHLQDTPSRKWTVAHGLGCEPVVQVYILYMGNLERVLPAHIKAIDMNTTEIAFTQPQSGKAILQ